MLSKVDDNHSQVVGEMYLLQQHLLHPSYVSRYQYLQSAHDDQNQRVHDGANHAAAAAAPVDDNVDGDSCFHSSWSSNRLHVPLAFYPCP